MGLVACGPQFRALQGAGALGIDLVHRDHDHGAGVFVVAGEALAQGLVGGQAGAAVDAHRGRRAGNEEHQADAFIAQDVAQGVDPPFLFQSGRARVRSSSTVTTGP